MADTQTDTPFPPQGCRSLSGANSRPMPRSPLPIIIAPPGHRSLSVLLIALAPSLPSPFIKPLDVCSFVCLAAYTAPSLLFPPDLTPPRLAARPNGAHSIISSVRSFSSALARVSRPQNRLDSATLRRPHATAAPFRTYSLRPSASEGLLLLLGHSLSTFSFGPRTFRCALRIAAICGDTWTHIVPIGQEERLLSQHPPAYLG